MNRKSRPAAIFIILFGLSMLVGLPWYIFSVLNKHSKSTGQSDAVVYVLNGKPVLATVVKDFKANSVGSRGSATIVSGRSRSYARAIDIESGKELWNVQLDAENDRGQDWGDAALLAQSEKYLFFLRNELYVINKEDGKIVARNEDLKDIHDKLMKESTIFPSIVTNYTYEDSLHAIIIKGADGLAYQLDINTLRTRPAPQVNPAEYFFKKQIAFKKAAVESYDRQQVTFTSDKGLQFAFMDDNDFQLLQKGDKPPYGHTAAPRRSLYTGPASATLTTMKKTDDAVYLFGGLLKAGKQDSAIYSKEQKDFYNGPYQLLSRGDEQAQTPYRLPGGGYIILHRASVALNAPILLTAVTPDGKKQWNITTSFANISRVLMTKDLLLILGRAAENAEGEVTDILSISVADGKSRTYNFKEGKFS